MHKIPVVGLVGLLMGAIINPGGYDKVKVEIDSNTFGPYRAYQNDVTISYTYTYGVSRDAVREEMILYNVNTGVQCYKYSRPEHIIGNRQYLTVSFNLPLSRYFGPSGLKIRFLLYDATKAVYDKSVTIYPIAQEQIVVNDVGDRYQTGNLGFKLASDSIYGYGDDFNFTGFKDYIDADAYYDLNLSGVTFLHNSPLLNYSSAELTFPDPKSNFKFLSHTNGYIKLPLDVVDEDETKKFKFSNTFYVDRLNLDLSTSSVKGFVSTNRFFLPVNKKKDFLGSDIKITLKSCGFARNDYIFNITYDVFRELIGSCNDSDYCIRGEIE